MTPYERELNSVRVHAVDHGLGAVQATVGRVRSLTSRPRNREAVAR
jgi:hypothetical protein